MKIDTFKFKDEILKMAKWYRDMFLIVVLLLTWHGILKNLPLMCNNLLISQLFQWYLAGITIVSFIPLHKKIHKSVEWSINQVPDEFGDIVPVQSCIFSPSIIQIFLFFISLWLSVCICVQTGEIALQRHSMSSAGHVLFWLMCWAFPRRVVATTMPIFALSPPGL